MLLAGSPALLLACVTSVLVWPLQQATTIIYRGCAYREVVGKEQALWFCLADNLCAMFHCQDNNVFSLDDCGCVPPHAIRAKNVRKDSSNSGTHVNGVASSSGGGVTITASPATSTMVSSPSMVLSGGSSIVTSLPRPPPPSPSSSSSAASSASVTSHHAADCQREIHIDGLLATRTAGSGGGSSARSVYIEPRGVIDLGNGSAFYDGYSYMAVPMYSNANFYSGITVEFVMQEGTSTLRQVLLTNCKHGQGASLEVILDVDLGVILFRLMYRFRDALNAVESVLEVAVPYTPFTAKQVALVFDGQRLTGRVNNSQRSASVQGHGDYVMARRAKPLMFGNTLCDVDDVYSYRGQIKQISIYRCAKNVTRLS